MATISPRKNRDGTTSYRVMFRRVGYPPIYRGFATISEAREFAKREEEYLFDHDAFIASLPDPLTEKRRREFKRDIAEIAANPLPPSLQQQYEEKVKMARSISGASEEILGPTHPPLTTTQNQ